MTGFNLELRVDWVQLDENWLKKFSLPTSADLFCSSLFSAKYISFHHRKFLDISHQKKTKSHVMSVDNPTHKFKDNWETFSLSGKEFVVFSNVILRNRQAGHGLLRCCGTEAMPGSPKPRRLEGEGSVGCFLETDSLLTETLTGPARCTQLKMHC